MPERQIANMVSIRDSLGQIALIEFSLPNLPPFVVFIKPSCQSVPGGLKMMDTDYQDLHLP